jgi:penicillin V acylase-like amidase (Ntn superfamily)
MSYKILSFLTLAQILTYSYLDSCTRMFWNDHDKAKIVARTMDLFISDEPQMWVNSRGLYHESTIEDNGLKWTSVYGNVAISAFHRKDLITDGMNEQGLAVHSLALRATQYENRDHRPGLHYGEWLQYLLDTCQTVEEALKAHQHFQVVPVEINSMVWPIHLMMEDATGDSAIIEFVNGQMQIYHDPHYRVGTNDPTYDKQLKNLADFHHGGQPLPTKFDPVSRFVRASIYLDQLSELKDGHDNIPLLKDAITHVFQNNQIPVNFLGQSLSVCTLWTVILDLTHRTYHFFPNNPMMGIVVDFSELDFSKENSEELSLFQPTQMERSSAE